MGEVTEVLLDTQWSGGLAPGADVRVIIAPPDGDVPDALVSGLRAWGHQVDVSKRTWSSAQVIVVDPGSGRVTGGSDPRSDGAAVGVGPVAP